VQTRNHSFHYDKASVFAKALQAHSEIGELIVGEVAGISRNLLVDDLQVQIMVQPVGGDLSTPEEHSNTGEFMKTVAAVSGAFLNLAQACIDFYVGKHPEAVSERINDKVNDQRLWGLTP